MTLDLNWLALADYESAKNAEPFIAMGNMINGISRYELDLVIKRGSRQHVYEKVFARSNINKKPIMNDAKKFLNIAWQTELSVHMLDDNDDTDFRFIMLQTLPVQIYYSIFNIARAYSLIEGSPVFTHKQVLERFQIQNQKWVGGTWSYSMKGNPKEFANCTFTPDLHVSNPPNPLKSNLKTKEYMASVLRTTHKWRMEEKRVDYLRHNAPKTKKGTRRKQLESGKYLELCNKERASTLFDFLYQLRIRANYRTAEDVGHEADEESVNNFHNGLVSILEYGMLFHESLVLNQLGLSGYESLLRVWQGRFKGNLSKQDGPSRRFEELHHYVTNL